MKVLKFGGSSLGSVERISVIQSIIENTNSPVIIVVSALRGVTDQLIDIMQKSALNDCTYIEDLDLIEQRHIEYINAAVISDQIDITQQICKGMFEELHNILKGVHLLHDVPPKIKDLILSYGERISAIICAACFKDATFIDSRTFIKTNSEFNKAVVDFDNTNKKISEFLTPNKNIIVIPGFIGSDDHGVTTTLGRGGSDYTGAIVAAALDASALEIWTDVDGFMTADPKKVSKAMPIEHLSYAEAMELSHFGAKVIYTPTIQPVFKKNIQLLIKNSFNVTAPGTIISQDPGVNSVNGNVIKGISSIDHIHLISLQGAGMVGVKGISGRLFSALASANVNIILITQASSEYSITFAIAPNDNKKAIDSINKEFDKELFLHKDVKLMVEEDLSIIAIVGEEMKNTPGISANLFKSLAHNGISVVATAQGSSELNISVVIRNTYLKKALNAIHEGFFLSHVKELHLFIVGVGLVGKSLLDQIDSQKEKLLNESRLKINVVGISNSRKMTFDVNGIDLSNYSKILADSNLKADMPELVSKFKELNLRNSVFIDCTANENVAGYYQELLDSFVSIVAANKVACSSDYSSYKKLKTTAQKHDVKFMYETNVGAGLPIINTINDLIRSGDKILKLEAVLSGTLNFIFNVLSEEIPMSKAIYLAKEKGYSEPDPRIDLSGVDVIRKLVILGREAGYPIEQNNVVNKSFLPKECFDGSLEDFWEKVKDYDQIFEEKRKKLVLEEKKWRFVAKLDNGQASVELMEVEINHPSFHLEGSNNILLLTTERYKELPMVIKGYGAGAEVTAAGVFADIIRIANI